jgi:hypothetical protein
MGIAKAGEHVQGAYHQQYQPHEKVSQCIILLYCITINCMLLFGVVANNCQKISKKRCYGLEPLALLYSPCQRAHVTLCRTLGDNIPDRTPYHSAMQPELLMPSFLDERSRINDDIYH